MFKKGDEVMFFFFKDGVHIGRGTVHKVDTLKINDLTVTTTSTIHVSWIRGKTLSLEPDEVYPFDNDKYIEMCDAHEYRTDKNIADGKEMSRLQKICSGD